MKMKSSPIKSTKPEQPKASSCQKAFCPRAQEKRGIVILVEMRGKHGGFYFHSKGGGGEMFLLVTGDDLKLWVERTMTRSYRRPLGEGSLFLKQRR